MTTILIVEDQTLVRNALTALLNMEDEFTVIEQVENGEQALAILEKTQVDIVLSDIEMPVMGGIELAEQLQQQYPTINTVIMTTFSRAGYIRRCLEAGVSGFVLKEAPSEYLIETIKKVMAGKKVIDPELAMMALGDQDPLTEKERGALQLAATGLTTNQISQQMHLSEGTVRNYLSEAISKMNAVNRIDAARMAKQKGWL